jgi:hypothetical protein
MLLSEGAEDHLSSGQSSSNPLDQYLGLDVTVIDPTAPSASHYPPLYLQSGKAQVSLHDLPVNGLSLELLLTSHLELYRVYRCNVLLRLEIFADFVFYLRWALILGGISVSAVVEVSPEADECQGFVVFHLLAEEGGGVEFGTDGEHDLLLDAAVIEAPSAYESIREVDFYLPVVLFDAFIIGLQDQFGHLLLLVGEEAFYWFVFGLDLPDDS